MHAGRNLFGVGRCDQLADVGFEPYWRESHREVDFVIRTRRAVTAIEVKSGRSRDVHPGLAAFEEAFRPKRTLLVGGDGIAVEEFLSRPVGDWLAS